MPQKSTLAFSATTGPTRTIVAKTYTPVTPIVIPDEVVLRCYLTDSATLQAKPVDDLVLRLTDTDAEDMQLRP